MCFLKVLIAQFAHFSLKLYNVVDVLFRLQYSDRPTVEIASIISCQLSENFRTSLETLATTIDGFHHELAPVCISSFFKNANI